MQLSKKTIQKFDQASFFRKKKSGYKKVIIDAGRKMIPESAKRVINSNQILKEKYDWLRRQVIKPIKTPRVYIKKGISRTQFFEILHQRNVDYVLLRWWQDFPEIPTGEDMDILIRDEHRDLLDDLLVFYDNGTGLKCDIYTITGSKYGCRRNLPYFQCNLAHALINTRELYRGVYVPSSLPYFASLAYHAVYHKGFNSGLEGFVDPPTDLEHNYSKILKEEAKKKGLAIEINVEGLVEWLEEQNFAPADDTLSKLVELKPELDFLQKPLFSDIRGGDLLVYIIRERLLEDDLLKDFESFLKDKFQFDILDVKTLSPEEKLICKRQIRGGKWDRGPYKHSGGPPAAFVVAFDYHPWPLNEEEAKKQTRMTNRNNPNAKYEFRDLSHDSSKTAGKRYNGVHSADNEQDAWFYLNLLGEEYHAKILEEVEQRRNYNASTKLRGKKHTSPEVFPK